MSRTIFSLALVAALAVAAPAYGQATRTWVSGVGDDANPCSRTAPCKTFAGAISKTATNGEINVIDPGGFGAVTITKSITIDGYGPQSSILAVGTTGIIINGAGVVVTLRNLSINAAASTAGSGIRILNADSVNIDNVRIANFTGTGSVGRGVSIETSTANVRVAIANSELWNMGNVGIASVPSAGNVVLDIDNVRVARGGSHGIHIRNLTKATISRSVVTGHFTGGGLALDQSTAVANVNDSLFSNNQFGITSGLAGGAPTTRLYRTVVTGSTTDGLQINSGSVFSFGNNGFRGNVGNQTPTPPILGEQ
ncbi:MAG TPA: right-handed parallel beta-helix repeat-containing protein [Allosphingosinicella sp.]|nr:right-handed parallel beta-helix repeat-containing protein [Allosphingosinicella sp.]